MSSPSLKSDNRRYESADSDVTQESLQAVNRHNEELCDAETRPDRRDTVRGNQPNIDLDYREALLNEREARLELWEQSLADREIKVHDRQLRLDYLISRLESQKAGLDDLERSLRARIREVAGFALFPLLPVELRIKIWSFALDDTPYREPRVHPIHALPTRTLRSMHRFNSSATKTIDIEPADHPDLRSLDEKAIFLSPHTIHPLLHACRESRDVALDKFNLTFVFGTFVNFKHDIIFLDGSPTLSDEMRYAGDMVCSEFARLPELKNQVRKLAIHVGRAPQWVGIVGKTLKGHMGKLEELYFVVGDQRRVVEDQHSPERGDISFIDCERYWGPSYAMYIPGRRDNRDLYGRDWQQQTENIASPIFKTVVVATHAEIAPFLEDKSGIPISQLIQKARYGVAEHESGCDVQ